MWAAWTNPRVPARRWVRRPLAASSMVVVLGALGAAAGVHAQTSAGFSLAVDRDASALDCPDAAVLRGSLGGHRITYPSGAVELRIRFSRRGGETRATLRAQGARSGIRELSIPSPDCAALIEPLSVAMALLLDPDATWSEPPPEGAGASPALSAGNEAPGSGDLAPPTPSASTALPLPRLSDESQPTKRADLPQSGKRTPAAIGPGPLRRPVSRPRSDVSLGISAGPSLVLGVLPRLGSGAELEAWVGWRWATLRLGGAAFLPSKVSVGTGQVEGKLTTGRLALCGEQRLGRGFRGATCASGWAGRLEVDGKGYWQDGRSVTPFWAAGASMELAYSFQARWGALVRGGWMVPTARQRFEVAGVGEAFREAPVAGWMSAGIWVRLF